MSLNNRFSITKSFTRGLFLLISGGALVLVGCSKAPPQETDGGQCAAVTNIAPIRVQREKKTCFDFKKVEADCIENMCCCVDVTIEDRRIRLLGFEPTLETIHRDVLVRKTTWLCFLIGTVRNSRLVFRIDETGISAIELGDQEPIHSPSIICFEELERDFGDVMTKTEDGKIYVQPDFLEEIMEPNGVIIPGSVPVKAVIYDHPL